MTKQIISFYLILMLCSFYIHAQTPNQINYQGIAHQLNGNVIANQNISIRLSIHHAAANGVVQYAETRNITTSSDGLFNIQIGSAGTLSTTGSWSSITWDNGVKFLQVEMDASGGTNFTDMGTQQLVSVPYAQHAKQAASLTPTATINPSQLNAGGASTNDVLQYDGTNWIPSTIPSATLSLPYNVSDPNIVSFGITNNSSFGGSAIYGKTNTNHANACGIKGESTGASGNGVFGKAAGTNSFGVLGQNTTGVGVKGISTSNKGVEGLSTSGIALYGSSSTGYALETNGKIKIAGGNTNPSKGAVLTSDSLGNAKWKNNRVAFSASEINYDFREIPSTFLTSSKVEFSDEDYDLNNNFNHNPSSNSNPTSSLFTVPVSGIYNLKLHTNIIVWDSTSELSNARSYLKLMRAGIISELIQTKGYINNSTLFNYALFDINAEFNLAAGDKVWVEVIQENSNGNMAYLDNMDDDSWFKGTLLIAD